MPSRYIPFVISLALASYSIVLAEETPAKPTYVVKDILGWTVYVNQAALADHPETTKAALEHLHQQLYQATLVVPAKSVEQLQRAPIWLANDEEKLGIAFHPSRSWLIDRGYAPPKETSLIGMQSANKYLHESLRQPWLIFHELCHGYDWFTLGESKSYGNAVKADHYRVAMKSGKYVEALHWNSKLREPYHASNHMEFFAETSEAFFGTNDIFPFVRAELRDHDPATYRLLGELWGVNLDEEADAERELVALLKRDRTRAENEDDSTAAANNDDYQRITIEGWMVAVHPSIASEGDLYASLQRRIKRDLHYAKRYLPVAAVKRLQNVSIRVEVESETTAFVRYLPPSTKSPKNDGTIEIGNVAAYRKHFVRQPSIIVKALAAAYYDRVLSNKDDKVRHAFDLIKKSEHFRTVLRFDGQRVPHPALAGEREMFMELSTTMFGTNDHFPFVKAELIFHDAELATTVEKLWQVR